MNATQHRTKLARLADKRVELDRQISDAIQTARDQAGLSWQDVAAALGTSRQAAWERYSRDEYNRF